MKKTKIHLLFSIHFLLPAILLSSTLPSPGYYKVKILEINQAEISVKMHVKMFNPDAGRIYDSVGFGLHLLNNGKWGNSLISEEISFEDFLDAEWCQKYANGFVKSVTKVSKSSDPPTAILTVYCTDIAWLSHLSVGEEWESYAYEVARQYDICEPILYNPNMENYSDDFDESVGWMPVPSFLFAQNSYPLPNVVFLPKFTESSYFVKDTIRYTKENHHELLKLHGKYIKDLRSKDAGILVCNEDAKRYEIHSISNDFRGGNSYEEGFRVAFPEEVGLLELKPNFKRRTPLLSYVELFRWTRPVIKSVQRQGTSITLEVTGIYDIDELKLNKARVLKLICNNFVDTYNYIGEKDSNFPLSKLLKYFAQKEKNYYDARGILPKVADGIILSYSYEYPDQLIEDYDSMERDSLIEYFEKEQWPNFKFHIELSDEIFGEQLDHVTQSVTPITLNYVSGDVEHWEQAILWKDYQHLVEQYLSCNDIKVRPGMTYSYKKFPQEVLKAFSDLIVQHQLTIEVGLDHLVELSNEFVVLTFLFDRGDFTAKISKKKDDFSFGLWEVINYLDRQVWSKEKSKDYPTSLMRLYAKTLSNELNPVFSGDFHWYEGLKAQKQYESSLIGAVRQLDKQHPIYQKFRAGDKSWKTDMEAYIEENGIQLKYSKK
ncbi:MAG: hypothetical protein AAF806_20240 [Bacteroidota bacterium]